MAAPRSWSWTLVTAMTELNPGRSSGWELEEVGESGFWRLRVVSPAGPFLAEVVGITPDELRALRSCVDAALDRAEAQGG